MHLGHIARRAVAAVGAVALSGAAALAAGQPQFDLPTGRVTYKLTGKPVNGTSVLTWIERGKKFRQDTKVTLTTGQQPMQINGWSIGDGKNLYTLSPMFGKTVMRSEYPKDGKSGGVGGLQMVGAALAKGKKVGTAKILDRTCDIREIEGSKVWVWKGIPLKVTGPPNSPQGQVNAVATKIETNVRPPASAFKVPAGYQVTDMKGLMPTGPGGAAPKFSPRISTPKVAPAPGKS